MLFVFVAATVVFQLWRAADHPDHFWAHILAALGVVMFALVWSVHRVLKRQRDTQRRIGWL